MIVFKSNFIRQVEKMFDDIGKKKGFFYFSVLLLMLMGLPLVFLRHDLIC